MFISLHVAPSSPPPNLQVSSTSHTSITITWDRVPCVDRNAEITQYTVIYGLTGTDSSRALSVTDINNRMFTAMTLIPRTNYTIQVEAAHLDISASVFLIGPRATVTGITETSPGTYLTICHVCPCAIAITDVGFFLNRVLNIRRPDELDGVLYPNNSAVALADIGEDLLALYCLTNLTTCCTDVEGGVAGEWFLPGQTQAVIGVDAQGADSADFTAARAPSALLLNRRNNAGGPTGIFTCRIPDGSGQVRTAYIGVDTGTVM